MKSIEFLSKGEKIPLIVKVSTYPEGNLAIKLYTESHSRLDFWETMTVNLTGLRAKDCAFLNPLDIGSRFPALLKRTRLAASTGQEREADGILYTEYCFDAKKLQRLDPEGYTYYARRQKGELGRKYERLYIALLRLSKYVDGFHYTDYSGWRCLEHSSDTLPLWVEAEDPTTGRQFSIIHQGAVMQLLVTEPDGSQKKTHFRRKEDMASTLLTLFQNRLP
ncbi:DUF4313 domain-containing protein [Lacrimispora amygdalina]|uniref:DUF4313 domain-containing protein n=1 Tax=Lacrimispora amygdalina TaxID=253257 RepID=A0A3E2N9A5_9FIRM|nr:DUF4313 domain-containing protein [Clostridium indicum]RFZ77587.1 DUF4313 domain-containing protein [Clostridium indicum]